MKQFTNARAYIFWGNVWRHVHVLRTYDQMTIEGGLVNMLEFKLSKNSKVSYSEELSNFRKARPRAYKPKGDLA
jgi:hypothetical protein